MEQWPQSRYTSTYDSRINLNRALHQDYARIPVKISAVSNLFLRLHAIDRLLQVVNSDNIDDRGEDA